MAKPYSIDLRERVVAAVETGGLSRRRAASHFGVGVSTVINWVRRFRATGSVAPGQMGGHKPKAIRDAHRACPGLNPGGSGASKTSRCAGWWRSWPRAASGSITGRCGTSSTPRN